MKLYLVQHGLASPESIDPQRALDEKGIVQTQRMADFLRTQQIRISELWHSKKLRAAQTAQILAQHLGNIELIERGGLDPQDSIEPMFSEIENRTKDLVIVGHLPFLQKLAGKLLNGSVKSDSITFRNSGIICLDFDDVWKIAWIVNPNLYI